MSGRLLLLDVLLAATAGLLIWHLRGEWQHALVRRQALLGYHGRPSPAPPIPPLQKPAPFDAAAYAEVAQGNLFTRDRNPNVIVDVQPPPPPKPVPPFPVARGVMLWDGAPPTVVLSQRPGGEQRGYHPGDTIGEWKIVAIDNRFVTFAWDGKEFKKRIDELLDRTPLEVAMTPQPQQQAAAAPKPANTNLSASKDGMGVDMGGGLRACTPGDKSPNGTVIDGMKKVVSVTPFGESCRWEPAK